MKKYVCLIMILIVFLCFNSSAARASDTVYYDKHEEYNPWIYTDYGLKNFPYDLTMHEATKKIDTNQSVFYHESFGAYNANLYGGLTTPDGISWGVTVKNNYYSDGDVMLEVWPSDWHPKSLIIPEDWRDYGGYNSEDILLPLSKSRKVEALTIVSGDKLWWADSETTTIDFTSKMPIESTSSLSINDAYVSKSNNKQIEIAKLFGTKAKEFNKLLKDEHIIAQVGNKSITLKEFALKKLIKDTAANIKNKKPLSNKEILESVIREKNIQLLAERLGVYPNEEEVSAYINNIRSDFEKSANPVILTTFTDTLGISIDDYWNKWAVPLYKQCLINTKVGNELAKDIEKQPHETDEDFQKRLYNNYEQTLKEFANMQEVEILDKNFIE